MRTLPENYESFAARISSEVSTVEGFLSPNEIQFLALLAACPTADGEILEIGSFKGRSTVVLAKAARFADCEKIFAVDPMTAPSDTDPDLRGHDTSVSEFLENLRAHNVEQNVVLHQQYSYELAKSWNKPIRLLWIDGDHTYEGTRLDLEGFRPFLADGAIVAIHDVLHEFEGGVRVVAEDILLSPGFGACGFVGSIAWAQFCSDPAESAPFRDLKLSLYRKLTRLIPYVAFGGSLSGIQKKKYKLLRTLVPHGPVDPRVWLGTTACKIGAAKRK